MISYAISLWVVAALFIWFGVKIYNGRTDLINDYHKTRVKDMEGYAKAHGKLMWVMGKHDDMEKVRAKMQTNLCGEIL